MRLKRYDDGDNKSIKEIEKVVVKKQVFKIRVAINLF